MKKGHNSLKKSSIFILLKTLIILIIALRLSFVFVVNSAISLNKLNAMFAKVLSFYAYSFERKGALLGK
ncbi:hypothetical protein SAMN05421856_10236 [Chryseobacterium taichungense]|uniref:Uncharacterized protein n=1 Tax=Chryseobacterium taichungense TaxID=295069 RepID=A0A1H7WVY0_9FLAO|nr:hypothetical protein SAMN05421856_10236 [Chryseobacterium taichungense]